MPRKNVTTVTPAAAAGNKILTEAAPPGTNSKLDTLEKMLRRDGGATVAQLVEATGWQAHSVRGAMSGAIKRKRGLSVASDKVDGVRVYRIAAGTAA